MKRRKFLYGLGATTAGATALVGSGAFTTGMLDDREADIDVVNDSDGVMSLLSMQPNSEMIFEDGDGRLGIDFTAGGASGVNVGGDFKLGYLPGDSELLRRKADDSDWGDETLEGSYPSLSDAAPDWTWYNSAFAVWNRATQTYDLTVEYDAENPGGSVLELHVFNGDDPPYEYGVVTVDSDDPASLTIDDDVPSEREFYPGKRVFVSLAIDTNDGHPDDDLSGELTLTADNPR